MQGFDAGTASRNSAPMTTGPTPIDSRVNAMIREFAADRGFAGMPEHRLIYRALSYPDTRQVWQVALGPEVFALKLDHEAQADGRLAKEFAELQALSSHFAKYDKLPESSACLM